MKDKVAIVTGAYRGIGSAVAMMLAKNDASVVIHSTNENTLNARADEIATYAGKPSICASRA